MVAMSKGLIEEDLRGSAVKNELEMGQNTHGVNLAQLSRNRRISLERPAHCVMGR